MTCIEIKITSDYVSKDKGAVQGIFKYYDVGCKIEEKDLSFGSGTIKDVKDIAEFVLFQIINSTIGSRHVNDPQYKIRLWEGYHPLRKCKEDCPHFGYTQRPPGQLREELTDLLHDQRLIDKVKKRSREFKKNPPKILFDFGPSY